jgi:sterol desaturase/sphingolipid hydroxylase (fatty acid hydroxylase superfamily)
MRVDALAITDDCLSMSIETPSKQAFPPVAGHSLPRARLLKVARQSLAHLSTTRTNGRAGLVADVGISIALLGAGLWRSNARPVAALGTMLFGLLLFSFFEYCVHRWLFHGAPQILEEGHRKHHEQPLGYDALPFFLPPFGLLVLAGLLILIVPAAFALLLSGALAAGYAAYGLSHTAIHNLRFHHPLSKRWAAIHHIHHYHPDTNFGVTTPLWDILLGTRYVSKANAPRRGEMVIGTTDR